MNSATLKTTDYYLNILSVLSNTEKLDLISKLIQTMKPKRKSKTKPTLDQLKNFQGDWGADLPVNTYVNTLRTDLPSREISW